MQFTVEPEGKDWVASDGQRRFINYDPVAAGCDLLEAAFDETHDFPEDRELMAETAAADASMLASHSALRLIQLLTLTAPAALLRKELQLLTKHVERVCQEDPADVGQPPAAPVPKART